MEKNCSMTQPSAGSTLNVTAFDDHQFHEVDLTNIARLGRQWFGESFEVKEEQEFDFNFLTSTHFACKT
jgi:hypothetical protein